MSKTYKTKPSRIQIAEATAKYGEAHVNWHTDVTFWRYRGDKEYIKSIKTRKHKDWNDNYDY